MPIQPETLKIAVNENDTVTAMLYPASKKDRAGVTIILGHGAGAGQSHPFMQLFARGLAERGFDTMTFNFVYMEHRRGAPDPKAKLEACYRAVIEAAQKHKRLKGNRVVIGGKSMGGRIASYLAARPDGFTQKIAGLIFLGYPLHAPQRPEQLRVVHFADIRQPMLFVQGTRDPFGTPVQLEPILAVLDPPAQIHKVMGGDHSFSLPRKWAGAEPQIFDEAARVIVDWVKKRIL
jgi:uncharacterized protein